MHNLGTLIKYEWKKLFQKKIVWISMIITIVLMMFTNIIFLFQSTTQTITDENGHTTESTISGYEYMKQAIEDAKKLEGTTVTDSEYDNWKESILTTTLPEQFVTEKEIDYWEKKIESISLPFTHQYAEGWNSILTYVLSISTFLLIMIAISLSGIFADEHKQKTDQMILCMKYGKKTTYFAKILTGFLFSALQIFILYGITFSFVFYLCGTDGFSAPLQLYMIHSPYPITVGQAVLLMFGMTLLAALVESAFAMFLSEVLNNSLGVMAILVGILISTNFFIPPENFRVISQIWDYIPSCFLAYWRFLDGRLLPTPLGYLNMFESAAIFYLLFTILFLFFGKRKYEHFQISGR